MSWRLCSSSMKESLYAGKLRTLHVMQLRSSIIEGSYSNQVILFSNINHFQNALNNSIVFVAISLC